MLMPKKFWGNVPSFREKHQLSLNFQPCLLMCDSFLPLSSSSTNSLHIPVFILHVIDDPHDFSDKGENISNLSLFGNYSNKIVSLIKVVGGGTGGQEGED